MKSKQLAPKRINRSLALIRIISLLLLGPLLSVVQAVIPDPGSSPHEWLDYWSFTDTNNWPSELGHTPMSFTNLNASLLGNRETLVLDSTNVARLRYRVNESGGATNLTVDRGSVMFWFAPSWSGTNQGGSGPGQWGRLIEVGSYTTNASYGWWSLYVDPAGVNLYFSAQTNNGSQAIYLSVPIAWTTNRWHLLALNYTATNSALYLDGVLATNGTGVAYRPGADVLTNGFYIGSDSNGIAQARGMFDDLSTYDHPLAADTIANNFDFYGSYYYLNPYNSANFVSAPSTPTVTPTFNAVTGSGYLTSLGTNTVDCVTSSNIWITNVVATISGPTTNRTVTTTFTIAGGTNGVLYDVFANSILAPASDTNHAWAWMGQGYHCTTNSITNLPLASVFLILGTPLDSDQDGLTDAYERLVSKTDPNNPDTDGDGMLDGWEVMWGTNPRSDESAQTNKRFNYTYTGAGWLTNFSGILSGTFNYDAEGNVSP